MQKNSGKDVYKRQVHQGKLAVSLKVDIETKHDLSLAYTPGVAEPCLEIAQDREQVYRYTGKGNAVAIVTDGTAVLGLGDIGPEAALPVMEGKACLFKRFGGVDAYPICLKMCIRDRYNGGQQRDAIPQGGANP